MRTWCQFFFLLSFLIVGSTSLQPLWGEEPRPNILLIISDDQGYRDAGFQGGTEVRTPYLDQLAASGVRCSQGYASHPFCSPTRAGLLTGRYQARFGHEYNPVYDPLDSNEGLPLSEQLLPQLLADSGYRTGWIGKWHLGASPAHAPWNRGFSESFGFIGGGHQFRNWQPNETQYSLPLIRNGQPTNEVPEHLTTALGTEAASFIHRHSDSPWFLYLAFNAPHTPHQPTPAREQEYSQIENPQRRRCLAQISLLDDAIGSVLTALDESGQRKRTLVFFIGDNGGAVNTGADNGVLRGQKGGLHEGGIRVPFLVSWPERLASGATYDRPVISFDAHATALAAAGVALPRKQKYDSVNLLPYLQGEQQSAPHQNLCWRVNKGKSKAIREGNWKLLLQAGQPAELFDLQGDPEEKINLAESKAEVLKGLQAALNAWEDQMIDPVFPGTSVKSEDWGPGGANQKKREEQSKQKKKTNPVQL